MDPGDAPTIVYWSLLNDADPVEEAQEAGTSVEVSEVHKRGQMRFPIPTDRFGHKAKG